MTMVRDTVVDTARVRSIELELLEISRKLSTFHDSAAWYTHYAAGLLAKEIPAGQCASEIPAGELVRLLENIHSRAIARWREDKGFDQREVPVD